MRQATVNKELVLRKLKAMTEGPTPILHHVTLKGDMLAITIQPWGSPIYISWSQAEVFAKDLPIELPPAKKAPMSEQVRVRARKRA